MSKGDDFIGGLLKAGLIIGSIWLGAEFLKGLSEKKDKGDGEYGAGTQPPN